jgi:hypothetical protein
MMTITPLSTWKTPKIKNKNHKKTPQTNKNPLNQKIHTKLRNNPTTTVQKHPLNKITPITKSTNPKADTKMSSWQTKAMKSVSIPMNLEKTLKNFSTSKRHKQNQAYQNPKMCKTIVYSQAKSNYSRNKSKSKTKSLLNLKWKTLN